MAIELTKKGKYRARLNYRSIRRTSTFDILSDAEQWGLDQKALIDYVPPVIEEIPQIIERPPITAENITLVDVFDQWIETEKAKHMDRSQLTRIRWYTTEEFEHYDTPVIKLDEDELECLYDVFDEKGYTVATCNRYKSAFNSLWTYINVSFKGLRGGDGKQLKLRKKLKTRVSPAACLEFGDEAEPHKRYLLKEHLPQVINAATNATPYPPMRYLFLTLLFTGQRIGSIRRLLWSDIDLKAGTVRFAGNKQKNGKGQIKQVSPILVEELKKYRDKVGLTSKWLFPHPKDSTRYLHTYKHYWDDLIEAANLPYVLKVHDVRSTHSTWLIQSGKSIESVSNALNHSDTAVTARYIKVGEVYSDDSADFGSDLGELMYG